MYINNEKHSIEFGKKKVNEVLQKLLLNATERQ